MNGRKVEPIGSHRQQSRGMYELLQEYARAGIRICLDGKESDPGHVASTCLREGVSYMMDFIPERSGSQRISRINFTRIEDPEPETERSGRKEPHSSPKVRTRSVKGPRADSPPYNGWCS